MNKNLRDAITKRAKLKNKTVKTKKPLDILTFNKDILSQKTPLIIRSKLIMWQS